jgi:hypothetical protein
MGLGKIPEQEFLKHVRDQCIEWRAEHTEYRLWIDCRLALIDFLLNESHGPNNARRAAAFKSHHSLIGSALTLSHAPKDGLHDLYDTARSALQAGAAEACRVLGMEGSRFSANLMIEGTSRSPRHTTPAGEQARKLWGNVPRQYLEVVLETPPDSSERAHDGFFVPLLHGSGVPDIPGATSAYFNGYGSAVFKDDLPTLTGLSEEDNRSWRRYLEDFLPETMFVSLPFRVPRDGQSVQDLVTAAVLNMNVQASLKDHRARSAYHKEWLELARDSVHDFTNTAFYCYMLIENYLFRRPALAGQSTQWELLQLTNDEWQRISQQAPDQKRFPRREDNAEGQGTDEANAGAN